MYIECTQLMYVAVHNYICSDIYYMSQLKSKLWTIVLLPLQLHTIIYKYLLSDYFQRQILK